MASLQCNRLGWNSINHAWINLGTLYFLKLVVMHQIEYAIHINSFCCWPFQGKAIFHWQPIVQSTNCIKGLLAIGVASEVICMRVDQPSLMLKVMFWIKTMQVYMHRNSGIAAATFCSVHYNLEFKLTQTKLTACCTILALAAHSKIFEGL